MTLQFQSMVPIFEIVMTIAAYAPHLVALLCVLAVMVKPGIRKWLAIGPLLMFFSLAGWCMYESNQFAKLEGYDMSLPTMREALEDYISTGKGDMNDIIEGGKYPPVFGKIEMGRYMRTWLAGSMFHDTNQDASYLPEAYNKGDDWFEATSASR